MIKVPEAGASQSSTQESSSASQSFSQDRVPTYFTFWDMDDTSIDLNTNLIKNPHLLLPIMLFQTYSPNQHLGIMTNRNPQDNETDYSVNQYVIDLSRFGIIIPPSQIIFGGGKNNLPATQELHELQKAIETLRRQLDSLDLTAGPALTAKIFGTEAKTHFDQLIEVKFAGKNFHINAFLKNAFDKNTEQFHFAKGVCHREMLKIFLVDDLEKIAGVAAQLGENFVGIKASRGGKSPDDLTFPVPNDDYYQDDYLFVLANKIGLASYAKQLLEGSGQPEQGNVMLQMAALLYAWQAFPEMISSKHFFRIAKQLSATQLDQMAQSLTYIQHHANTHASAHYRPVDKIANHFRYAADESFLNMAAETLASLKGRMLALNIPAVPQATVEEVVSESSKPKKSLGSIFRSRSVVSSLKAPVRTMVDERTQQLDLLKQEEQALAARVAAFLRSQHLALASHAQRILGAIEPGSVVLPLTAPAFSGSSPSSSSSSSTSSAPSSSSSGAPFPMQIPASPLFSGLSRHRISTPSSPRPVFAGRTVVSDPLPPSVTPFSTDQDNSDPDFAPKPKEDKRLQM